MNGTNIGKAVGSLLLTIVIVVAIGYIGNALIPPGGEGEDRVAAAQGGSEADDDGMAEDPAEAEETKAEEPVVEAAEEAVAEAAEEAEELVAEATEEAAETAAVAPGIDLSMADVAAGQKLFKKCSICHTVAAGGPNRVGPNLFGIVGRPVGSHAGYRYSGAMAGFGGIWTVEGLNGYLTKPKDFLPGTKMKFSGLKKEQDRADLIAYLATLAD